VPAIASIENNEIVKLRERVAKAEWQNEATSKRLSQGSEAFSDMRASLNQVRVDLSAAHDKWHEATQPKPIPTWKVVGFAFGVLCTLATVVWMFARYPDREEFNAAQEAAQEAHKALDDDMDRIGAKQQVLATDQRLIKASQESADKSLTKIDKKLDMLLQPARKR
jgi:chromosome segregation ATPase